MSKNDFIEIYDKYDGDISLMQEKTNYCVESLLSLCRKHRRDPKNIPPKKETLDSLCLKTYSYPNF